MNPVVFSCITNRRKYAVQHNSLISLCGMTLKCLKAYFRLYMTFKMTCWWHKCQIMGWTCHKIAVVLTWKQISWSVDLCPCCKLYETPDMCSRVHTWASELRRMKMQTQHLRGLYSSLSTIGVITPRTMRWAEHVACEEMCVEVFVGEASRKVTAWKNCET